MVEIIYTITEEPPGVAAVVAALAVALVAHRGNFQGEVGVAALIAQVTLVAQAPRERLERSSFITKWPRCMVEASLITSPDVSTHLRPD
jgi:hypothetical protein